MIIRIFEEQKLLITAGAVSVLCALTFGVVMLFDPTEILGVNRWIKPIKFFVSIWIYLWTTAGYIHFIKDYERAKSILARITVLSLLIEMIVIVGQAARGTISHFNYATAFDAALYAVMGLFIVINTICAAYLLFLYFKAEIELPPALIWGMRLGLILFLAASFEGGYMAQGTGHSVGAADGGAGLPIVNWSTRVGDLRVAHFFGMHALQAVPLFAYTLEKYRLKSSLGWTFAFAAVYLAIFTFVFVQALLGIPLFGRYI